MTTEGIKNNWDYPLYLQCDCHQPHHAVIIEPDQDIPGMISVAVVATKNSGFFHRLSYALKYVFSGEHLTVGDVVLSGDAVRRLRDFCQTVMEKSTENNA